MLQRVRTNRYISLCVFICVLVMSVFLCNYMCDFTITKCALGLLFTSICVCRDMQAVENLLTLMSSMVQRHKKQSQLRKMCCEERVWKSHLNYSLAQAHLALLYQDLDQLHGGTLQHRFTNRTPATLLFCVF